MKRLISCIILFSIILCGCTGGVADYQAGYDKGLSAGYEAAYNDGYIKGYADGVATAGNVAREIMGLEVSPSASPDATTKTAIAETPKPTEEPQEPVRGYINAKTLNLRECPSQDCGVVQNYNKYSRVQIIETHGEWYHVKVGNIEGYMLAKYVSKGVPPTPSPTVTPVKTYAPVRVEAPVRSEVTVYITKTGSKYHRSGCRYLKQSKIAINLDDAKARGYTACSVCY